MLKLVPHSHTHTPTHGCFPPPDNRDPRTRTIHPATRSCAFMIDLLHILAIFDHNQSYSVIGVPRDDDEATGKSCSGEAGANPEYVAPKSGDTG